MNAVSPATNDEIVKGDAGLRLSRTDRWVSRSTSDADRAALAAAPNVEHVIFDRVSGLGSVFEHVPASTTGAFDLVARPQDRLGGHRQMVTHREALGFRAALRPGRRIGLGASHRDIDEQRDHE